MYTSQKAIRAAFWESFPDLSRRKIPYPIDRKIYTCNTRCAFVDFVDNLARSGDISDKLAQRVTL